MKNTSKTIVFFGTDDFSLEVLRSLVAFGYNIVAVVTKPDSKSGRGQSLVAPSVKKFAVENNIAVWQPTKVSDIDNNVKSIGTNPAGVLVSFGKIIPESIINLFNPGIINVHPSLLPKYRGPSPIETAIQNGDKQTGVSIMKLTAGMDAGPVYGQIIHDLSGTETSPELYKTLAQAGAAVLLALLPGIFDGSLQPTPQDDTQATYCKLIDKSETWLKPDEITATAAERLVRAHLSFPKTKINIYGHQIVILKAHVSETYETPLDILCQDGKYLSIDELIAPSGRMMSSKNFINGYI